MPKPGLPGDTILSALSNFIFESQFRFGISLTRRSGRWAAPVPAGKKTEVRSPWHRVMAYKQSAAPLTKSARSATNSFREPDCFAGCCPTWDDPQSEELCRERGV